MDKSLHGCFKLFLFFLTHTVLATILCLFKIKLVSPSFVYKFIFENWSKIKSILACIPSVQVSGTSFLVCVLWVFNMSKVPTCYIVGPGSSASVAERHKDTHS